MEALECKICVLEYSEANNSMTPRILTCGHTICQSCAKSLHEKEHGQMILCPFDRTETLTTDVSKLPRNFSILEVLREREETDVAELTDEKKEDIPTEGNNTPCAENGQHEAVWFCENCDADYCNQCFDKTHTSRVLSSHKKKRLSERPYRLPKCPNHPRNIAEFLCREPYCDVFPKTICHTCLITSHQNHEFEELMQNVNETVDNLSRALGKINEKSDILKSRIEILDGCIDALEESGEFYQSKATMIAVFFDLQKEHALQRLAEHNLIQKMQFESKKFGLEDDLTMLDEIGKQLEGVLENKSNFDMVKADELAQVGNGIIQMGDTNYGPEISLGYEVVLPSEVAVQFIES